MALTIIHREEAPTIQKSGFDYSDWYQKNKKNLLKKRKSRYENDKEYREAALRRSKEQRDRKRQQKENYLHNVPFTDAAQQLGVTVWVLREWRSKNYFPEPKKRSGRLWFQPSQVELLERIRVFFEEHGVRVTEAKRSALEDVINFVYSNWNS